MEIFLDTNVYLHCVPLEEIWWEEVFGESHVTILIPKIIINELDKCASDSNSRISKRAKSVLKQIDEIGLSGKITKNIEIKLIKNVPPDDVFQRENLDRLWADDYIIATVKCFNGFAPIVTNDTRMKIKCHLHEVLVHVIPEKFVLKKTESEEAKQIRKLKEELHKHTALTPRLEFSFLDDSTF